MDPYYPRDEDLREWADGEGMWPVEDFELMVAEHERVPLLLELVASPQRLFALRCLYLVVGDAVRSNVNTTTRRELDDALDGAAETTRNDPAIQR